jgi:hypothetical protein
MDKKLALAIAAVLCFLLSDLRSTGVFRGLMVPGAGVILLIAIFVVFVGERINGVRREFNYTPSDAEIEALKRAMQKQKAAPKPNRRPPA